MKMKYKIKKSSVLATMLMIAFGCFSFIDGYSQLTAACTPSCSNDRVQCVWLSQ